eukprot:g2829.t1
MAKRCKWPGCTKWSFQHGLCKAHHGHERADTIARMTPEQIGRMGQGAMATALGMDQPQEAPLLTRQSSAELENAFLESLVDVKEEPLPPFPSVDSSQLHWRMKRFLAACGNGDVHQAKTLINNDALLRDLTGQLAEVALFRAVQNGKAQVVDMLLSSPSFRPLVLSGDTLTCNLVHAVHFWQTKPLAKQSTAKEDAHGFGNGRDFFGNPRQNYMIDLRPPARGELAPGATKEMMWDVIVRLVANGTSVPLSLALKAKKEKPLPQDPRRSSSQIKTRLYVALQEGQEEWKVSWMRSLPAVRDFLVKEFHMPAVMMELVTSYIMVTKWKTDNDHANPGLADHEHHIRAMLAYAGYADHEADHQQRED